MIFHNGAVADVMVGDCLESLRRLPDCSAHMCVTSPPYYGLRDYGHAGQIGLEDTPDAYVARLVEVFREVRRVLTDDGTLWLNIGDSYARDPGKGGSGPGGKNGAYSGAYADAARIRSESNGSSDGAVRRGDRAAVRVGGNDLKSKDLIGIPWMLAFALRADGWYLRQEIIWNKPNPMPESVTDRCTKAHESVFLLSKSARYFFDHEAIKEPSKGRTDAGRMNDIGRLGHGCAWTSKELPDTGLRNKRSVWTVAPKPYAGAHFAVYPPELITPCILAGCAVGGVVLDPFGGSGTTAGVSLAHGRNAILCELNPDYAALMPDRARYIIDRTVLDQTKAVLAKIESQLEDAA